MQKAVILALLVSRLALAWEVFPYGVPKTPVVNAGIGGPAPARQAEKYHAAAACWKQISERKITPAEAANIIAGAMTWPTADEARTESPGILVAWRISLLREIGVKPLPLGMLSTNDAWQVRHNLTNAALSFVRSMSDAILPEFLKRAEAEVAAANRAIKDLPKELQSDPDLWDFAIPRSFEHVKNPIIKRALMRQAQAFDNLEWAKYLHSEAVSNMCEIEKLTAKMIRDLYRGMED